MDPEAELQAIVQSMVEAGESEADIALVIREYQPETPPQRRAYSAAQGPSDVTWGNFGQALRGLAKEAAPMVAGTAASVATSGAAWPVAALVSGGAAGATKQATGGTPGESILTALASAAGEMGGRVLSSAGPFLKDRGMGLYQRALKPTRSVLSKMPGFQKMGQSGAERQLAESGIQAGVGVTRKAPAKVDARIDALTNQLDDLTVKTPGVTSKRGVAAKALRALRPEYRLAPKGARAAAYGEAFDLADDAGIPEQLTATELVKAKRVRGELLKKGAFAGQDVPKGEGQKAIYTAMRDAQVAMTPGSAELNKKITGLIPLRDALDDAARRTGNRDPVTWQEVFGLGSGRALPLVAAFFNRPALSSNVGRLLYRTGEQMPQAPYEHLLRTLLLSHMDDEEPTP